MCGIGEAPGRQQNQGMPSCRSYHPLSWLWNVDNLSTAYKEAKLFSLDLSEEDSRHHMAKTHPRLRSFNLDYSSLHLHHLGAITASLGKVPRRPEKVLKRHWMSSWNLSVSPLISWNIWHRTETRGVKLSNVERRSVKPVETQQLSCVGNLERALLHQPLPPPFLVLTSHDSSAHLIDFISHLHTYGCFPQS